MPRDCPAVVCFLRLCSIFAVGVIHNLEPFAMSFVGVLAPTFHLFPRVLLAQLFVTDRARVEFMLLAVGGVVRPHKAFTPHTGAVISYTIGG